ncbi:spore germination protein GerW family protein [Pilimelia columellifera]|uniref:Sporulation protein YtfJ n=1 Tax=Pilimelia columellifera subsp. columellifera TaxID=706583 RepID=A0ABP6AVZ5_9ACTN
MTQTATNETRTLETIRELVDSAKADNVFGAPITRDEMTVLPVAKVSGGGGGGTGAVPTTPGREGTGTGAGLGLSAKPLGVYVIKEGRVAWRPAVDVNKVVMGVQAVAIVGLLVVRTLLKGRRAPFRYRRFGKR